MIIIIGFKLKFRTTEAWNPYTGHDVNTLERSKEILLVLFVGTTILLQSNLAPRSTCPAGNHVTHLSDNCLYLYVYLFRTLLSGKAFL